MKKNSIISFALLFLLVLGGCAQESEPTKPDPTPESTPESRPEPAPESKPTIEWDEGAVYAVAFLGYGADADAALPKYIEKYLPGLSADTIEKVDAYGDEKYLIIPQDAETSIAVFATSQEEPSKKGNILAAMSPSKPFVLSCNLSDLYTNCIVDFTLGEQTVSFSPQISLKDASVITDEFAQNITIK